MDKAPQPEFELPPSLRLLRLLVTVLTGVMIAGIVVIVALIWTRYSGRPAPLPEAITLPAGVTATAVTQGSDWFAVVTADDRILIFDRTTGAQRQEVRIERR